MENPFNESKPQRPVFLLILCILTFVWSGGGILYDLFSLLTAGLINGDMQIEQYSQIIGDMEDVGTPFWASFINSSVEVMQAKAVYAKEIALIGLALGVISLLGAILMFNLRKIGFYLYTAAQILMLFILPYFAGFSFIVLTGMLFSAFFTILFIILYAVNLKYMK